MNNNERTSLWGVNMVGRRPVQKIPGRKPGWTMSPERKLSQSIAMKRIRANQKALREKYGYCT